MAIVMGDKVIVKANMNGNSSYSLEVQLLNARFNIKIIKQAFILDLTLTTNRKVLQVTQRVD